MHQRRTLHNFNQRTKPGQCDRYEQQMATGKSSGREPRQSVEGDEVLGLVPGDQLQRMLRWNDSTIKSEQQGGEKRYFRHQCKR